MKQDYLSLLVILLASTCSSTGSGASGPILMIHGHLDTPTLWTIQGPALAKATAYARFYDTNYYYPGEFPQGGFRTNGIYGVSYYQKHLPFGQFEPPISPVIVG